MKKFRLFALLITLMTFVGCDIDINTDGPYYPDEHPYKSIDCIRIDEAGYKSEFVYYDYDRQDRIIGIESTYYGTYDEFTYSKNKYGDEVVTLLSNVGDDRDIILNWKGYASSELAYDRGYNFLTIDYGYIGKRLNDIDVVEYYDDGSVFSEESYDFKYDYDDNLLSISRSYDEVGYYIDSKLSFSKFCYLYNDYNIDILSILDLYIDCDFASHIGLTGTRSTFLPTRATLEVNRNGRYDKVVKYNINYLESNGYIAAIDISSTNGINKTLYITYR